MARATQKKAAKSKTPAKQTVLDLDPDAWTKFEALVKSASKMGHRPHTPTRKKAKRAKV